MFRSFPALFTTIALGFLMNLPISAEVQLPVPVCQVRLNNNGTAFINTGSVEFSPLTQTGSLKPSPLPGGFPAYNSSGAGFLLDNEKCPVTAKQATIVFTSRPLSQATGGMLFGFRFGRGIDNRRYGFSALSGNMAVRHFDYAVSGLFRGATTLLTVPEFAPAWTTYVLTVTPQQMLLRVYDLSGHKLAESSFDANTPLPHKISAHYLPSASLNLPVLQSGIYGIGQSLAKDRLIAVISVYDRVLTLEQQETLATNAGSIVNKNNHAKGPRKDDSTPGNKENQAPLASNSSPEALSNSSTWLWMVASLGGLTCILALAGLLCYHRRN